MGATAIPTCSAKKYRDNDDIIESVLLNILEEAARGCVGIVASTLGKKVKDLLKSSKCYDNYQQAERQRELTKCNGTNMKGQLATARIFSIHTYSGTVHKMNSNATCEPTKSRNFKKNQTDSTYDVSSIMDGYAAGSGLGNYDFAVMDKNIMIGATISDLQLALNVYADKRGEHRRILSNQELEDLYQGLYPCISIRSKEDWEKEYGPDNPSYNTQFWCVTCECDDLLRF